MLTDAFCTFEVFPLAFGSIKSNASGVIAGEVSRKNTNNRNTISVIELMLNSALTLFLPRKFIKQARLTCPENLPPWLPFDGPLYRCAPLNDCNPYRR